MTETIGLRELNEDYKKYGLIISVKNCFKRVYKIVVVNIMKFLMVFFESP